MHKFNNLTHAPNLPANLKNKQAGSPPIHLSGEGLVKSGALPALVAAKKWHGGSRLVMLLEQRLRQQHNLGSTNGALAFNRLTMRPIP